MASPFRIFRKYQKTLLVVAGVVLMFVFVIGDALMTYIGRHGSAAGGKNRQAQDVAVRWENGGLTNAELNELTFRRKIAKDFVLSVWASGERAAMDAGVTPQPLRVQPIFRLDSPETPSQGVERDVVEKHLLAEAARKAGMQISNESIIQYLEELGRGNVTHEQMRSILHQRSRGSRVNIDFVLDALREELLARDYLLSNQFALQTTTPQQRWEDWLSVNDRVVIEAAPISAESYLPEVKEPTEGELTAFFDKYKNDVQLPDKAVADKYNVELPAADPGFRIPRKVDAQFVRGDYDEFLTKIEGTITDDEIAQYYDEHKKLFIKTPTASLDSATNENKDANSPATSSEPPGKGESSNPTKSGEENQSPQPKGEPNIETKPTDEPQEAAPAKNDQSSTDHSRRGVFQFTAFLQEKNANEQPSADSTDQPSTATQQPAESPATKDTSKSNDSKSPMASPTASAEPVKGSEANSGSTETAPSKKPEKPVEYQTLEEARDQIRLSLAKNRTAEELKKTINKVVDELDGAFTTYSRTSGVGEQAPPPATLADVTPIAEKYGLKAGRTGPVSILDLRELPVGKAVTETGNAVAALLFLDRDLPLYKPIVAEDEDVNRYVVLKMSETPDRVPELSEVREKVVRAWKMQRAAELAKKRAEELATEAQTAHASLGEFFADKSVEVIHTDPFAKMTGGEVSFTGRPQPFRLEQPKGIVAPGPELMDRVFGLKPGDVAAVENNDHTIAYVVRLVEHQDPPETLRSNYLSEANNWPGLGLKSMEHFQELYRNLVVDIMTRAGVEWKRTPDRTEQEQQEAG